MNATTRADARRPGDPVAHVLLVVNQPVLAEVIKLALSHGRATTRVAPTVEDALAALENWRPHLAILDLDLADGAFLDGLGGPADDGRIPVVGLTRRGDLKTKLAAFERGTDDLLTVPFAPEELVARVLAVLRRAHRGVATFDPVLRLGELELDILNRSVRAGGHELRLTSLEQGLLYLLAANTGRVVTRDEILDHLWGADFVAESNVVDRHVRGLRVKLQDDWHRPRYIATVPGRGYRFLPTAAD
jgi:two-component system KDP operon response regulator KdpE